MVDVTDKVVTVRIAKAEGKISMLPETISAIQNDALPKGNVLTTAKISGIQSAKKTAEMIPMCHQLNLSYIDIEFEFESDAICIRSIVKTKEATGVEMEALSAVSGAALTIYDMCKSVDKSMIIGEIKLVKKVGGKSDNAVEYRPDVGVITLSDSISSGQEEDKSGPILIDGFSNAGCVVNHHEIYPDGSDKLISTIQDWVKDSVALSKYGEIEVNNHGETSMPGVFAAGDVTTVPYKQIIIAMGEGSKAALGAFDFLIRN